MVTIQFKSFLADLRGKIIQPKGPVDPNLTWIQVLDNPEIFDPQFYYVRTCNGEIKSSILDKVRDFTAQFKRTQTTFVVYIHKVSQRKLNEAAAMAAQATRKSGGDTRRRHQAHDNDNDGGTVGVNGRVLAVQKVIKKKSQRGKGRPKRVGKSQPVYVEPEEVEVDEEEEDEQVHNLGVGGVEANNVHFGGFSYVNDGIGRSPGPRPVQIPTAQENHRGARRWEDLDELPEEDVMSQDSQDDVDQDMRPKVANKLLKKISSGDMIRTYNELLRLKRTDKYIRVTRHMPFTMGLLQNIFLDE